MCKKANVDLESIKSITQREIDDIADYNKIQKSFGYKTKSLPNYDEIFNKNLNDALKGVKQIKSIKAIAGLFALGALATSAYMFLRKPLEKNIQLVDDVQKSEKTQYNNEWEEKYSEAFGSEADLIEYTPQKGEYWISILQAKYSTDYETAKKMANKIKEMIYGDANAAKQTPIMYLPETWNFEGKTYNYNADAIPEKTTEYSDNVITEQGKMSKDLEY